MYQAFISYSHAADKHLAPVLQRALERLGTPWWRRSPVRVFRDDDSLPASAALWATIETALATSEYFVLFASPAAAQSKWVQDEVAWWLANRSLERLLIVVTAGTIGFDAASHSFDPSQTDCLPKSLFQAFTTEPHYIDLRFATGPNQRTLRHSGFRSAALSVAAAVRGVRKDDLETEDIRQHRRSLRLIVGGASVAAMLALVVAGSVWFAGEQSAAARASNQVAQSRQLAARAVAKLESGQSIAPATMLATLAWRLAPTDEARAALKRIEDTSPDLARILSQHSGGAVDLAFMPDGRSIATAGQEGAVLRWNIVDGRSTGVPMVGDRRWIRDLRFSRDGTHLLTRGSIDHSDLLDVFRVADGTRFAVPAEALRVFKRWDAKIDISFIALSPSGRKVAAGADNAIVIIDTGDGSSRIHSLGPGRRVMAIEFLDDEKLVFVDGTGNSVRAGRLDLRTFSVKLGASEGLQRFDAVIHPFNTMSPDASHAVLAGFENILTVWSISETLAMRRLKLASKTEFRFGELTGHHAPRFDTRGRFMAAGLGGTMHIADLERKIWLDSPKFKESSSHGPALALSADGAYVAVLDGSTPVVWRLGSDNPAIRIETRCGVRGFEEACIRRLCERLTGRIEDLRLKELLEADYESVAPNLKDSSCRLTNQ